MLGVHEIYTRNNLVSNFGKWLKANREQRGWSLRGLEKRINKICNYTYIDQLEKDVRGKKKQPIFPNPEIVDALADVFSESRNKVRGIAYGYDANTDVETHSIAPGISVLFDRSASLADDDKVEVIKVMQLIIAGIVRASPNGILSGGKIKIGKPDAHRKTG